MSSALQIEYLSVRATMLSPTLAKDLRWIGGAWRFPEVGRLALYSMGEPELSTRSLSHVVGNVLSQIDKPKRERTRQSVSGFTGRYGCFEPDPAVAVSSPTLSQLEKGLGHSILCLLFAPGFSAVVLSTDQVEVRNSLLKTVLALEIYRRQHGGYPETLAQLVPDFMPEIPDDVFELSLKPLKYRRDGNRALIWSVSQDGVDDAGNVETGKDMGYLLGPKQPKPSTDSSGDPAQMPE